jgi:hypothetical protein
MYDQTTDGVLGALGMFNSIWVGFLFNTNWDGMHSVW